MLRSLLRPVKIRINSKMSKSTSRKLPKDVKQDLMEIEKFANNSRPVRNRKTIKISYEESPTTSDTEAPKKKVQKIKNIPKIEVNEVKAEKVQEDPVNVNPDLLNDQEAGAIKKRLSPKKKEPEPKGEKYIPDHWEELIQNMREMRKTHPAPVDTMGCSSCHEDKAPENVIRFQKLVALMLSSQTRDEVTFAACQRLKKFGFTPEELVKADVKDLEEVLKPVGFYKTKAKHIQRACEILIRDYNSDIPDTIEGLMKLPGVGSKMAHICMKSAWDKITGIGVDTHVHRISNRLKFVKKETKTPEQTRVALEEWLPREYWDEVNLLMVGFGQTICTPIKPKCADCLSNQICPNAFKEQSTPKKKKQSK